MAAKHPITADDMESSATSVQRGAETLMGIGFSELEAYKNLATQLHVNLLELRAFIARREVKR